MNWSGGLWQKLTKFIDSCKYDGELMFLQSTYFFIFLAAENDHMTKEFYERPVAVAEFQKHCAQRRKYPVLMKLEFNSAIKDREVVHTARHGMRKANQEKNQNPRIIPCELLKGNYVN
jgi:hypothetical protein